MNNAGYREYEISHAEAGIAMSNRLRYMRGIAKTNEKSWGTTRVKIYFRHETVTEFPLDSLRLEEDMSAVSISPSEQTRVAALSQAKWFADEVQPHEASLRSYLRRLFPSLPDVDDLVQESYARLIRARTKGRVSYAKAFLFTTARNAALDLFRRKKVVSIESVADLTKLFVLEEGPDAAAVVNKQEELELLASAVRGLPDRCRQVLTLRLMFDYSQKQIADEMRISEHTVKAQLAKGMRRCAEFFEQRGISTKRKIDSDVKP
jgi:RNA polymerase sigma factor (sigma-70 family)